MTSWHYEVSIIGLETAQMEFYNHLLAEFLDKVNDLMPINIVYNSA